MLHQKIIDIVHPLLDHHPAIIGVDVLLELLPGNHALWWHLLWYDMDNNKWDSIIWFKDQLLVFGAVRGKIGVGVTRKMKGFWGISVCIRWCLWIVCREWHRSASACSLFRCLCPFWLWISCCNWILESLECCWTSEKTIRVGTEALVASFWVRSPFDRPSLHWEEG